MRRLAALAAVASLILAALTAPTAHAAVCSIAAAGDIAGAGYVTNAKRSGDLIRRENPDTVIALGDIAYYNGTDAEFDTYYDPSWGSFEAKTEPIAGNHEYKTPGAAGMVEEFGAWSDDNRAIDSCGWRVVLVNQYKGPSAGADFIRSQRTAYPSAPILIAWHAPRWSSGSGHGSDPALQPLWAAARQVNARIVLNAHDHNYERFAPQDTRGAYKATGTRQFVSGLGGWKPKPMGITRPNSEVRYTGEPAVLFLALNSTGGYSWRLLRYDGALQDSGTG